MPCWSMINTYLMLRRMLTNTTCCTSHGGMLRLFGLWWNKSSANSQPCSQHSKLTSTKPVAIVSQVVH